MNKYDRKHLRNLRRYQSQVDALYDVVYRELANLIRTLDITDDAFTLARHPILAARLDTILAKYGLGMETIIVNGVDSEWTLSNNKNNALSMSVFGERVASLTKSEAARYFSTNDAARKAFLLRKTSGLSLSDRVWKYRNLFRNEIEASLEYGIRTGMPATELAGEIKQWLRHPDMLFRRVRDVEGVLHLSKAAEMFHPGQGVYRSSYMNARRLAATETNIAYRTSDYLRWQQMDFVVGIEIHLSNNHTTHDSKGHIVPLYDICDELQGKYPKDFKFVGWHPHCRCYATTILKTEEELMNGTKGSENAVNALPPQFAQWINDNEERIENARSLPYFIKDNRGIIKGL